MAPRARNILVIYGEDKKKLSNAVCNVFTDLQKYAEQHKVICTQEEISDVTCNIKAAWLKIHKYKVGFVGPVKSPDRLQEMIKLVDQEESCYYLVCCSGEDGKEGTIGQFIKKSYCAYNENYWYHVTNTETSDENTCDNVVDQLKTFCGVLEEGISPREIVELRGQIENYISTYYTKDDVFLINEENAKEAYDTFNTNWSTINPFSGDIDLSRKPHSLYGIALMIYTKAIELMPTVHAFSEDDIEELAKLIKTFDGRECNKYYYTIKRKLFSGLGVCWYNLGKRYYKDAIDAFKQSIFILFSAYSNVKLPKVDAYGFRKISKHFLESLVGSTLNITSPYEFNDPFDTPILTLSSGDPIGELVKEAYKDTLKISCFSSSILLPKPLDSSYEDGKKNKLKRNKQEFLNPLMWAHYADNHKGICIKYCFDNSFSLTGGIHSSIVTGFRDIKYSDKALAKCSKGSLITTDDAFFLKGKAWEYENELRFFCFDLNGTGSFDQFGNTSECIKEIYFGLRCPKEDRKTIIQILSCKKCSTSGTKKKKIGVSGHEIKFFQIEINEKKLGTFKARKLQKSEIEILLM